MTPSPRATATAAGREHSKMVATEAHPAAAAAATTTTTTTPPPHGHAAAAAASASGPPRKDVQEGAQAAGAATLSVLQIWAPTLVLIFGGCCSNVYTLESLIHASPSSGPLLTAGQFLLIALATAPRHLSWARGWRHLFLRERAIPLQKWLIYTAYFLTINVLNNVAFKYRIGVPLHIILRSAGPVTTMAVGRVWGGKRYPPQKMLAVVLLFAGVVLAAFADAGSQPPAPVSAASVDPLHGAEDEEVGKGFSSPLVALLSSQAPGFALLASALVLSACMGLYTDDLYATHGRSGAITAETLFYSHAMSLPFFASQARVLMREFANVTVVAGSTHATLLPAFRLDATGPNTTANLFPVPWGLQGPAASGSGSSSAFPGALRIPRSVLLLALNAATQLLCIVGVNRLSAQSSSLTVGIVLNIRKLASLVLSIWLFGNSLPAGVLLGALIVFVGGALYAMPVSRAPSSSRGRAGDVANVVGASKKRQ